MFSVTEISFPSIEGDLFVTFDHVELMSFLIGSGKNLISIFFISVRLSETFIWSKGTPCILADFGLLAKRSSFAS